MNKRTVGKMLKEKQTNKKKQKKKRKKTGQQELIGGHQVDDYWIPNERLKVSQNRR